MRYLVISPCEDARTGVPFAVGDEFLPEPEEAQAERLIKANCLRVIPDNAPDLPGNPDAAQEVLALREQLQRADNAVAALNGRLEDAKTQHGKLADEHQAILTKLNAANESVAALTGERDDLKVRVAELEGMLAEATKPAEQTEGPAEQPAKPGRAKN